MPSWTNVTHILSRLPGTAEDPPERRIAVRAGNRVIAFPAANERSRPPGHDEDEEFVVVRVTFSEREALLADDPETFFVTPHYQSYPGVIVRMSTVDPVQLRELLHDAWRLVSPKRIVASYDTRHDAA